MGEAHAASLNFWVSRGVPSPQRRGLFGLSGLRDVSRPSGSLATPLGRRRGAIPRTLSQWITYHGALHFRPA